MHQPTTSVQESDASFAENARRAQDLRTKAQQLAIDELCIMNQAVGLNLLAKQLADATMRPRPALAPTALPLSFFLSNGIGMQGLQQQALQVQLRAQPLAGAPNNGLPALNAAAAAAIRQQQLQQQCAQATAASSADIGPPQKPQHGTGVTLAAAQQLYSSSSSVSKLEASSGLEKACNDLAAAAEQGAL